MKGKLHENICVPITITNHTQYIDILNKIRKATAKIIIVQINGFVKDDPIVETAKQMMILEKQEIVDRWFGTIAPGRKAVQYTFQKKRAYFGYLSDFESFFIVESENPYEVAETDFGFDDIAFIDQNGEMLFYTTTHEGYAYINEQLMSE